MGLSCCMKFCLVLIILGALLLIVGSVAPFWSTLTSKLGYGLWYYCADGDCQLYDWGDLKYSDFSGWYYGVHVAAGLATIISIVVLFISLARLCSYHQAAPVTGVGVLAIIGGVLGTGAAVVFFRWQSDSLFAVAVVGLGVGWAFTIFCVGCGVLLLFAIILLVLPAPDNAVQPY